MIPLRLLCASVRVAASASASACACVCVSCTVVDYGDGYGECHQGADPDGAVKRSKERSADESVGQRCIGVKITLAVTL
jgi:hypothetical protein